LGFAKACRKLAEHHRRILNVFDGLLHGHQPALEDAEAHPEEAGSLRLCLLAMSHARAVDHVFRTAPTLWPAAAAVARCALEAGMIATWIMRPDDPATRKDRWCSHLVHSQERFASGNSHLPQYAHSGWKAFKKKGQKLGLIFPSFDELLEQLGEPSVYPLYVWACQYAHGSTWAVDRMVQEQTKEDDASRWCVSFRASATGLTMSGATVFSRLGAPTTSTRPLETVFRGLERVWETEVGSNDKP
jgi:hypothetical protein